MIDETLTAAIAAALESHPDQSVIPGVASGLLDAPNNGVLNRTAQCLEAAVGTTSVLLAIAQYHEDNDDPNGAQCLRLFAQRFAVLEAAVI